MRFSPVNGNTCKSRLYFRNITFIFATRFFFFFFFFSNVSSTNDARVVSAMCIRDNSTAISGGQVSRKLSYKDNILELSYEEGSPCAANPSLKHKTIVHFVCRYQETSRSCSS